MPVYGGPVEKLEYLAYAPGLQDSDDLEAGTNNITATSEPGAADYSTSETITAPTDSRIVVTRLGVRLSVTIDSFGAGAAALNYRIKRGGTSIGTGTLATGASTGNKLVVHDVTSGTLTGAATYEVFLWADHADGVVVSVCQLWVGVGSSGEGLNRAHLRIDHTGEIQFAVSTSNRQGSGTVVLVVSPIENSMGSQNQLLGTTASSVPTFSISGQGATVLSPGAVYVGFRSSTVTTDLFTTTALGLVLRSLQ